MLISSMMSAGYKHWKSDELGWPFITLTGLSQSLQSKVLPKKGFKLAKRFLQAKI